MPVYNHYYPDSSNNLHTAESIELLEKSGPCIPVTVGVTPDMANALQAAGKTVPTPVSGLALIDTGASICGIDEDALLQLGIPPFGYMLISTPSGAGNQNTYPASLAFPGTPIPNITFTDFVGNKLKDQGILVIVGRNILKYFVLVYNGPGGHVSMAF